MKHVKTFENFVSDSVSEDNTSGFNPKAKALLKKYSAAAYGGVAALVSDWWADVQSEEEENAAEIEAVMKRLGSTPETTIYVSSTEEPDTFEEALEMIKKSGLKYEERDAFDGYQEVYVKAK
jgi:hypothetical protein